MFDRKFKRAKKHKLARIESILRADMDIRASELHFDCLSDQLRQQHGLVDTENVSAHGYDQFSLDLIEQFSDGLVLDCGAGKRQDYLDNVINLEIVPYRSTDVLAAAQQLPFVDQSIDAVLSLNVLEHVRDPFASAAEIVRVLKPGGKLYCVVPFLQPVHAYPDHYYNMTAQGLRNLFAEQLTIDDQKVIGSGLPIWGLSWILGAWNAALPAAERKKFQSLTVAELMANPLQQLRESYVQTLPKETNFELASTTALFGTKPS